MSQSFAEFRQGRDFGVSMFENNILGSAKSLDTLLDEGFQCHQRGQLADAEKSYLSILQVDSRHVDALHLLGLVRHQVKRHAEAVELIQQALSFKSAPCSILLTNLGAALQECKRWDEAEDCYRRALHIQADYLTAHQNLCRLLTIRGRAQAAAIAWSNFGNLMLDLGKPDEALIHLRFAQELAPDRAAVLHDTATALARLERLEDAVRAYRASLQLDGQSAMCWNNLGWVLFQLGRSKEAIDSFRRAIDLAPDLPEPHMCLAMTLLRLGQFEEGWAEYEWRWRSSAQQFARKTRGEPLWDGQPLNGRSLLIESEQGIGDVLQFVRYVDLLYQQGEKVAFHCPTVLLPLLQTCTVFGHVVYSEEPPQCDLRIALLSLPSVLGTTVETIPKNLPYLRVPPTRIAQWHDRLKEREGLRIGIVWQGNTSYLDDRQRSYSLQKYGPLAQLPDVQLISLQKGKGSEQVRDVCFPVHQPAQSFDEDGPFLDAAAVMANLDLVIAPNTSLAHLAGALGVPVWVILSATATDWRWIENREDTPWYPGMRLYTQKTAGDWDEVFNRVYTEVAAMCKSAPPWVASAGCDTLKISTQTT